MTPCYLIHMSFVNILVECQMHQIAYIVKVSPFQQQTLEEQELTWHTGSILEILRQNCLSLKTDYLRIRNFDILLLKFSDKCKTHDAC